MTSFNNSDLYNMLLHRLRKDRRGAISPEEFESFLRWRNLDYYNKMFKDEQRNKYNDVALKPFFIPFEAIQVALDATTTWYSASLTSLTNTLGNWDNVWFTTDVPAPVRISRENIVEVDIVSETELPDRLTNAITGPTATKPIGHFTNTELYVHGIEAVGYVFLSYYKLPDDPVYDYYVDAYGTVTYLTEGQAAYTLQAGEIAKDGSTAGQQVTSTSIDIEWEDDEAVDILDMIVSDVSVALADPGSFQASLLERKEN
jgi:hypothetical protein